MTDSNDVRHSRPTRRAPILWRDVFFMICRSHHPNSFFIEDVYAAACKVGIDILPESLRVKLARYVSKGFLNKTGRKEYQLTTRGQIFFDLITRDTVSE